MVANCNIPFREAHFITGHAVSFAESLGKDISTLNIEELKKVDDRINEDAIQFLDLRHSMNARNSQGGTSEQTTKVQIKELVAWMKSFDA